MLFAGVELGNDLPIIGSDALPLNYRGPMGARSLNKIHVAIVPPYCWDLNCRKGAYSRLHRKICHMLTTVNNINLLLTEFEGRTGVYWPEVVAAALGPYKNDEGQYSPAWSRASEVISKLFIIWHRSF